MVSRIYNFIYMYKKNLASIISLIILILLTGIGSFLRLWRLQELFHFTYDEEIIAFVGKRMFVNGHIPLIGGVTPMHIHLAPYFYWLSGIILGASNLNPLGWGIAAIFLSALVMLLLYKITKEAYGTKSALLAIFFYSFSFYQNIFDRHYWGVVFNGLVSLCVIYSLLKIKQGKPNYSLFLAAILAYGFHTDPSTLVLLVLVLIAWYILKLTIPRKMFYTASFIFIISFLPLIIFDIRHNFVNISGLALYSEDLKTSTEVVQNSTYIDVLLFIPRIISRLIYVWGDPNLAIQYSYCSNYALTRLRVVPLWFSLSVTGLVLCSIAIHIKSKKSSTRDITYLLLLLNAAAYIGVFIYGVVLKRDLFDHYLSTLFPTYFILLGALITTISSKSKIIFPFLILYMIANIVLFTKAEHRFGYKDKMESIKWVISMMNDQEFSLDVIGDCFRYNGYRYLFYLAGKEPVKSYVDANFTHLYDKLPADYHPQYLVVFTNPDWVESPQFYQEYLRYKQNLISSAQFGSIEVLIVDNQNLDFVGKF